MQSDTFTDSADMVLEDHFATVETASHPDAQKLLAFWDARPSDGIVVGRDIPSREISGLLSSIAIWEPLAGWSDMRARLSGASVQKRFGFDVKGHLMSECFPPEEFLDHLEGLERVIKSGQCGVLDSRLVIGAVEKLHLEVVVFPVLSPDRTSTWALMGLFYFN